MRYRGESAFLTVFMVFLGYLVFMALSMTARKGTDHDVGTNFFPLILSAGMLLMTLIVFIRSLLASPKEGSAKGDASEEKLSTKGLIAGVLLFFGTFVILLAYILILQPLGFQISTILFMLIVNAVLFRLKNNRFINLKELLYRVVGFAAFAFGMAWVFENVFGLILP